MRKGGLKQVVRIHLEKQTLRRSQLRKLTQLQKQSSNRKRKNPFWVPSYWVASFVASFLVVGLFYYAVLDHQSNLNKRIGAEVAGNHIKLKPLEVHTNNIQSIRQYFTELDFSPIESSLLIDNNTTLLGGRYCSIQGVTAAQLRLKDNTTGQVHSLYQTIYDSRVFSGFPVLEEGEEPITVYANGLEIDIWVEKGVLFAITR